MSNPSHKPGRVLLQRYGQWLILLLIAFALRAVPLDGQGLWRDEVDQWYFARDPWPVLLGRFTQTGWNGPLYSPLLRVWMYCAGDSVYAMRYLSLLCGWLSIALCYALGRRLLGKKIAMVAAALMAFSPYMVWYAQEVKMYAWLVMWVLLALYALERACREHRRRWWLLTFAILPLLFYSHILTPLLLPVMGGWFLLRYTWKHPIKLWVLLALLVLLALSIPLLTWIVPTLLEVRETGFPHYTLLQMATILLNGWSAGMYQAGLLNGQLLAYAMATFSLLCLVGLLGLGIKQKWDVLGPLLIWIALPVLALWVVSLRGPLFADRYLIWGAPGFYLLCGTGLVALWQLERWLGPILLIIAVFFNSLCLYAQAAYPIKPQFLQASACLQERRAADALLLFQIPYNHRVVAYYTPTLLNHWAEAPFTNWRLSDGSYQVDMDYVDAQLRALIAGHTEVWLVYSEVAQWDERELVKIWLDTHAGLLDTYGYQGVTLYHYTLWE
ncbi:MAG TPA: glycosyltransferase family 39 protein [Anaerolineae bacterium]|nr:glycosyltransferase family 39 protein [Anaerolineae bacterium]